MNHKTNGGYLYILFYYLNVIIIKSKE